MLSKTFETQTGTIKIIRTNKDGYPCLLFVFDYEGMGNGEFYCFFPNTEYGKLLATQVLRSVNVEVAASVVSQVWERNNATLH